MVILKLARWEVPRMTRSLTLSLTRMAMGWSRRWLPQTFSIQKAQFLRGMMVSRRCLGEMTSIAVTYRRVQTTFWMPAQPMQTMSSREA